MKFNVEKSITINAPLTTVRPLVEDFKHWNDWSPWTIVEPDCPITVEGQPGEVGHCMAWEGEVIGSGKNTVKSSDGEGIHYDLAFFKPWKSKAETSLLFQESGDETTVTWTMDSSMPFFLFFMIKTMKNWIGMDYERGLRMLKAIAETGSVNATTKNNGIVDYQGFSYVGLTRTVPISEMPTAMQEDFNTIVQKIVVEKKKGAMHWVTIYSKFDMRNLRASYIAAVSDEDLQNEDLGPEFVRGRIEDSRMIEVKHDGPYDFLGNAWAMGMMLLRAKKYKGAKYPFEQYWNSPLEEAPEDLKTSVYFPVKG